MNRLTWHGKQLILNKISKLEIDIGISLLYNSNTLHGGYTGKQENNLNEE